MKIAFDAKRAFNNLTGLGNYSRYIINALLELYPKEEYYFFTPTKGISQESVIRHKGNFRVCEPGVFLQKSMPGIWRTSLMVEDLKKETPHIYHGLSNELPAGIKKVKGLGKIVTIHDLIFLRYPSLYNGIDRYIYRRKFQNACNVADKIIAISQQTKEDIINFFQIEESKIEIHYQDCSSAFHEAPNPQRIVEVKRKYQLPEQYVLSVGTLEPRKNHINILKALNALKKDEQPFLVLAGKSTSYKKELDAYIHDKKLDDRVKILEFVPYNLLPALYHGASLFVYPSIFEGFGIPLLEAINCGVPVISSKGSCFREAGGDGTVYTESEDPEELANAMIKILSDDNMREDMKKSGLKHALTFRKENTIPRLVQTYKSLV